MYIIYILMAISNEYSDDFVTINNSEHDRYLQFKCPYKSNIGFQHPTFTLDNYGYSIDFENTEPNMSRISSIVVNDEAEGGPDGVYCWIIGSYEDGPKNLYCINVYSFNEIGTKHMGMMDVLCGKQIDPNIGHQINRVYYAGEFLKENASITFNFLSGSFMLDFIDNASPPAEALAEVTDLFERSFPGYTILNDTSSKTLITTTSKYTNITIPKINDIPGASVYRFDLNDNKASEIFKTLSKRSIGFRKALYEGAKNLKLNEISTRLKKKWLDQNQYDEEIYKTNEEYKKNINQYTPYKVNGIIGEPSNMYYGGSDTIDNIPYDDDDYPNFIDVGDLSLESPNSSYNEGNTTAPDETGRISSIGDLDDSFASNSGSDWESFLNLLNGNNGNNTISQNGGKKKEKRKKSKKQKTTKKQKNNKKSKKTTKKQKNNKKNKTKKYLKKIKQTKGNK